MVIDYGVHCARLRACKIYLDFSRSARRSLIFNYQPPDTQQITPPVVFALFDFCKVDVIFYKKIGKSFASSEKYCTFAAFFVNCIRMRCAVCEKCRGENGRGYG